MNCKNCGAVLQPDDQFCKNCGTPVSGEGVNNGGVIGSPMSSPSPVPGVEPVPNPSVAPTPSPMPMPGPAPMPNEGVMPGPIPGPVPGPMPGEVMPNQTPGPVNNKKKNNTKTLIVVIAVVAIIGLIAFAVSYFMKSSNNLNNNTNNNNNNSVNNNSNNNNSNNDNNNVSNVSSDKYYKVKFQNFTFNIPDNLVYETNTNTLSIGDEDDTWVATFEIAPGSYATLKTNKGQLQGRMAQNGMTATAAQEKTYGGQEYITMEVSSSGYNMLVGMTRANSMYIICLTVLTKDNDIDYDILEDIAPIIKSAEYSDATNSIAPSTSINMSSISDLAK